MSIERIRLTNEVIGPQCDKPTMKITLAAFDLGAFDGELALIEQSYAMASLCLCNSDSCSDAQRTAAMRKVEIAYISDDGKRRRDGITRIMDNTASSTCVDAAVAAAAYKLGFDCAATLTGPTSQFIADQRTKMFLIEPRTSDEAKSMARECFKP